MSATVPEVTREQVSDFRVEVQQLRRERGGTVADTAVLDLGVQETGPDGARWALALRGVDVAALDPGELAWVWSLRGAPHAYRRADLASVAAAVEPYSDADAGKRIFDAARPLKAAGIGNLEALDAVAAAMRDIVAKPLVKGEMSTRLTQRLPEPYLRWCRPCQATHVYEQTFRLAALRAGLELEPGTSPPVLRRIPGRFRPARRPDPRHDVVRAVLHLLGPATPALVAGFMDAPVKDVTARWPQDAVDVEVAGQRRSVLEDDLPVLVRAGTGKAARTSAGTSAGTSAEVRLLGPYDLFLQARDRDLLVPDRARAKALWPVIGRPGAVLLGGEIVGLWRPRTSGKRLTLTVTPWDDRVAGPWREAVEEQAERLASFRGVPLAGVTVGA